MEPSQPSALNDYLAEDIRDRADELVDDWITWIMESVALRPARMLPREAIRDHIPTVLRGIGESLRLPLEAVAFDVHRALRTHARLRHDQGFDIEELLKEYRGLEAILSRCMIEALERYSGRPDPIEVARTFVRLSEGLDAMTAITVSVYRETEVAYKRELHQQLEEYVRTISHELKQPINAITAGAGMLEEDEIGSHSDQRRRYLEIIRSGVERAAELIDDIRTLALVEGAEQAEEWRPIHESVTLVLDQLGEMARKKDVHLDVARPLPEVRVDSTRVDIALVNLVSNAIKYSDPDKDRRWARIEVERAKPDEAHRWIVRVVDNGLGIPDGVQPQIFERRFRAHPTVDQGTGLGLAISRQVIEQAGGRMWFESEEGRGSTFHFVVAGHVDEVASASTDH